MFGTLAMQLSTTRPPANRNWGKKKNQSAIGAEAYATFKELRYQTASIQWMPMIIPIECESIRTFWKSDPKSTFDLDDLETLTYSECYLDCSCLIWAQ